MLLQPDLRHNITLAELLSLAYVREKIIIRLKMIRTCEGPSPPKKMGLENSNEKEKNRDRENTQPMRTDIMLLQAPSQLLNTNYRQWQTECFNCLHATQRP